MNIGKNKETIRRFFDAFVNGRNDEMYAFLTDDAIWWVNGKSAFGGLIDKSVWFEQIKTVFAKANSPLEQTDAPLDFDFPAMIAADWEWKEQDDYLQEALEERSPSLPGRKDRLRHSEAPPLQMNDAFALPNAMPVLSATGMVYA